MLDVLSVSSPVESHSLEDYYFLTDRQVCYLRDFEWI